MMDSDRVIVTGAAGFIGFHLSERVLSTGATVHGIDNLNSYYDPSLKRSRLAELSRHRHFSFETTDIADHDRIRESFRKFAPTHVVNLAAQAGVRYSLQHPRAYTSSNVDGFLSILEGCRHFPVQHLVYASSSSVYGSQKKVPFCETDPVDHPISLYAATKRANELMAHTYAHLFKIPITGLRFFTVYGPWGRPDMAYYTFTQAISEGRPIEVYNFGQMSRDFTYVDDVAEAVARLLDKPPTSYRSGLDEESASHQLFNIGNHTPVNLERFIDLIADAVGRPANKIYRPMQSGDVPATFANVDRLTKAIGFAPSTPLETGIARFVEWFRDTTPAGANHRRRFPAQPSGLLAPKNSTELLAS
jgi:UDP-glucuronate 4-epimerase